MAIKANGGLVERCHAEILTCHSAAGVDFPANKLSCADLLPAEPAASNDVANLESCVREATHFLSLLIRGDGREMRRKRKGNHRNGPPPQFATVMFNGQAPGRERAEELRQTLYSSPEPVEAVREQLNTTNLEAGGLLLARLPIGHAAWRVQHSGSSTDPWYRSDSRLCYTDAVHPESLLVERLQAEDPSSFIQLSPLILYTRSCPCPSCARHIADFGFSLPPEVHVELVYNLSTIPEKYAQFRNGISDASSIALLREAGVNVRKLCIEQMSS